MTTSTNKPVVKESPITETILVKVKQYQQSGGLKLPGDYSPENALKSAMLILQDVKTKDNKPVLQNCDRVSIANTLFDMVVRGLSPMKKQCYFISYGDKLTLSVSYFGNMANAKRCGMKNIVANIIYEGDKFVYAVNSETGRKKLLQHDQQIENIDITKIKGAYAIFEMETGEVDIEIMTIKQIKQAWLQGAMKGNSPAHQNFTEEMSKRSVINRACKKIINSSDDSYLYEGTEPIPTNQEQPDANSEQLILEESAEVENMSSEPTSEPEPIPEHKKPGPKPKKAEEQKLTGPGF